MVVCPGYLAVAEALKRQYNLKCTFFNLLLLSTILEQQDTLQKQVKELLKLIWRVKLLSYHWRE